MEVRGFEPLTYGLQSHRSSQLSYTPERMNPVGQTHEAVKRPDQRLKEEARS